MLKYILNVYWIKTISRYIFLSLYFKSLSGVSREEYHMEVVKHEWVKKVFCLKGCIFEELVMGKTVEMTEREK